MYKTVRHGENSLQYTILPQNDDFRIEGKLSSAGSNCISATGRKGKARRPKRRSFFAYLGLIFVCTVIVGAVLIPFLVSAECLPNPTEWFLKTKSALTHGGNFNGLHRNTGVPHDPSRRVGEHSGIPHAPHHNNAPSIGQKVEIINRGGVEKIFLRTNKTQSQGNETKVRPIGYESDKEEQPPAETTKVVELFGESHQKTNTQLSGPQAGIVTGIKTEAVVTKAPEHKDNAVDAQERNVAAVIQPSSQKENNFVTEVRFETNGTQPLTVVTPTIVVTTARDQQAQIDNLLDNKNTAVLSSYIPIRPVQSGPSNAIRPTTYFSTTSIYSPHAPATLSVASLSNTNSNQNISAPAMPTITTRIMQLPLLKSTAKKPIIPPVLVRTNEEVMSAEKPKNDLGSDASVRNGGDISLGDAGSRVKGVIGAPEMDDVDIVETKKADWIQSHWPYVDPSTYFQWTGYKEDSVLLPALLGFALTGMILIIAICLVARNKRAIVSSVRKRNRNDVEEGVVDDNTTLLTNSNLSDED